MTREGGVLLGDLVARMEVAAADGDIERYYPLNLQFHRAILELGGNKRLLQAYQNCVRELHLFRRGGLVTPERMRQSNVEHRAILDALLSGDGEAAFRVMEAHVLHAKQRVFHTDFP